MSHSRSVVRQSGRSALLSPPHSHFAPSDPVCRNGVDGACPVRDRRGERGHRHVFAIEEWHNATLAASFSRIEFGLRKLSFPPFL